ncbi:unnamed protein product [Thelazia callipaeda]|uniref:Cation_ATPase_N domain-containing protein n=1 Tax=Thelazia callipaeda TaxID=103827 RepID=A0A0N5CJW7_THECL|nr:unnamed protein product [Thelazia callipaeda]
MAQTEILLCNHADLPMLFKLRSDALSNITALPAGSGCIPPRAEQRSELHSTDRNEETEELPLTKFTFEQQKEAPSPSNRSKLDEQYSKTSSTSESKAQEIATEKLDIFVNWIQQHPLEAMMLLLFFIALFFAILDEA